MCCVALSVFVVCRLMLPVGSDSSSVASDGSPRARPCAQRVRMDVPVGALVLLALILILVVAYVVIAVSLRPSVLPVSRC